MFRTGVVSHPRKGELILTVDYEALGQHYMTFEERIQRMVDYLYQEK